MDKITSLVRDEMPTVSIIVLTWNQLDLTLDSLASLYEMDYPPEELRIIVVDNGSSDGTVEALNKLDPAPFIVENGENLGFAEGNNVGIRLALDLDCDYVMLLNNDTVVDSSMLRRLIEVAEANPKIGIVTPLIYYYEVPDLIWCAGASIDWHTGKTMRLQAEQTDREQAQSIRDVDFASGCAICLKRQLIEDTGLLDPRFFMYYEEVDWCTRAKENGWRITYVPAAKVWHIVSGSIGSTSPAINYYMTRNVFLFLYKNHPKTIGKWITLARVFFVNFVTILAFTIKNRDGARKKNRNARIKALWDSINGRWGKMPAEADSLNN